jgi:hypothetical protein
MILSVVVTVTRQFSKSVDTHTVSIAQVGYQVISIRIRSRISIGVQPGM